jgi:DUF177 domain-containing protein
MIIKIANLSEGVHTLSFDEKISEIGISEPFFGNCKVDVKLSKSRSQIVLDAALSLGANYQCDRCGQDYKASVQNSYKMVYLFGQEPEENDEFNLIYLPIDADKINIVSDVRDYALLAVPMKKLCKEDCKGLCPKCGKDLNEGECNCVKEEMDPRWEPLAKLRNKLNN